MAHAEHADPDFDALAAFADGRLSESEQALAAEHLVSCTRCRTIVAELVRARSVANKRAALVPFLPLAASLAVIVAGGLYWVSVDRGPQPAVPPPLSAPPSPTPSPSPTAPVVTPPAPTTPQPTPPPPPDRPRAAGTRTVAGKEFRLVAGEWIDTNYRLADFLPVIDIQSSEDFAKYPALNGFRALAPQFTVVIEGTTYRVSLPQVTR